MVLSQASRELVWRMDHMENKFLAKSLLQNVSVVH
jgi:hypothetical protein